MNNQKEINRMREHLSSEITTLFKNEIQKTGENRNLTYRGLEQLSERKRLGLNSTSNTWWSVKQYEECII